MADQQPIPGYIRSNAIFAGSFWRFEQLSEDTKVALVTIDVDDGPMQVGLNREDAERLLDQLRLFLEDWPKDRPPS